MPDVQNLHPVIGGMLDVVVKFNYCIGAIDY